MPREREWALPETPGNLTVKTVDWGPFFAISVERGGVDMLPLSSVEARQLAEALVEAADELDPMRLGGTDAV